MKTIVYVPGAWDMLHVGHLRFLKKASLLGDHLIVGVQSDESIEDQKGVKPVICLRDRIEALENLRYVTMAVPYYDLDYIKNIKSVGANVLVLSDSHINADRFSFVKEYLKNNGGNVIYLPYDNSISSTAIKEEIVEMCSWSSIWKKTGVDTTKNDYEVCGYEDQESAMKIAQYMVNKLEISSGDSVLDFGCGSGVILKCICDLVNSPFEAGGIDVSEGMIERASKNNPNCTFLVSNHIPYRNYYVDHVICWGVFQYLSGYCFAQQIIEEMKNVTRNILIMEIPDIDKKDAREANRRKLGLNEFPAHLYYDKSFFEKNGFKTFDNEIKVTKNAEYCFTVIKRIKNRWIK